MDFLEDFWPRRLRGFPVQKRASLFNISLCQQETYLEQDPRRQEMKPGIRRFGQGCLQILLRPVKIIPLIEKLTQAVGGQTLVVAFSPPGLKG